MARLKINLDALTANVKSITELLTANRKSWSLVVKALGTDKRVLSVLLSHPCVKAVHSVAVSQWKALRLVKEIDPSLRTMYIKPPVLKNVPQIVKYADISLNSSFATIQALSNEAVKQAKTHEIIVMIEMGELREGILREGLEAFYKRIFRLPGIKVIGLGTNLGCMYGVRPTYDKLIQMVLNKQLVELKFKRKLELVSGASSITIPILQKGKVPEGINHFRIGEAVLLGTSPLNGKKVHGLSIDAFSFEANIVELYKKETVPDDIDPQANVTGQGLSPTPDNTSFRALLDFGILDVDPDQLVPVSPGIRFAGISSDLSVYDLGDNAQRLRTGDVIRFKPKYLGVARAMYSGFVEKVIE